MSILSPILLSDPRVRAITVAEHEAADHEPLVLLPRDLAPSGEYVRAGLAERLAHASSVLSALSALSARSPGVALRVVEGHRPVTAQRAIIAEYATELRALHPTLDEPALAVLTSRFVAPVDVAPHVAGAAVDLTLVDAATGVGLDLGTPIDATPEASGGRCFTASPDVSAAVRARRALLAAVLEPVGFVNYPTEWWHWSFGDRYWALLTGAPHARYGPVERVTAGSAA